MNLVVKKLKRKMKIMKLGSIVSKDSCEPVGL